MPHLNESHSLDPARVVFEEPEGVRVGVAVEVRDHLGGQRRVSEECSHPAGDLVAIVYVEHRASSVALVEAGWDVRSNENLGGKRWTIVV